MKRKLIATLVCSVSITAAAETISIRADEWFPMNGDPAGAQKGFMIDIASRILAENGHSLDYKIMPWERSLDAVRNGKFHCVVGAYKEDAPDFVFPKQHWGFDSTGVFVRADDAYTFSGLDSLSGRKVGVIKGYAYTDDLDNRIETDKKTFKQISGATALDTNINKLTGKRIDTVIESTAVFQAKTKALGVATKTKQAGTIGSEVEMYIACSPENPISKSLVEQFDAGLTKLRESGELSNIMANYGMTDWQK